jgi:hypothetical protein
MAALRSNVPPGRVFMIEGTGQDNATVLNTNGGGGTPVEVRKA